MDQTKNSETEKEEVSVNDTTEKSISNKKDSVNNEVFQYSNDDVLKAQEIAEKAVIEAINNI